MRLEDTTAAFSWLAFFTITLPLTAALSLSRHSSMTPHLEQPIVADPPPAATEGPFFHQGLDTYKVPMSLYKLNRDRLVRAMQEKGVTNGLILLEGGKQQTRYDTDHEPVFRQESYFHWAFGVTEEGCYGAIELPSGRTTLFIPRYDFYYEIVCGESAKIEDVKDQYAVDQVLALEELKGFVSNKLAEGKLHLLSGLNTDSGNEAQPAKYEGIDAHTDNSDSETLFDCMVHLRVFKTTPEIELMRYTNWMSSMAHTEVMRSCRPGMMEYQLESLFQHHTYTHGGCRHMSYTCICACGPNPAILHYGHAGRPNNRMLLPGDLALLDMGAEYHCYASDITCSFPVSGEFTPDQLLVYEAVLAAHTAVIQAVKPGIQWPDMHRLAERTILKKLNEAGLIVGDDYDAMIDCDLGASFLPCGLGHLIGIDTHDVGGYSKGTPPRIDRPGLRKLRTARTLEPGMVITVEPGCYFIDLLLNAALEDPKQSKFLNAERVKDFRGMGGVRIEDAVVITEDGCENLTLCPRTVEEVLGVMKGATWPPEKDTFPELKRAWVTRKEGKMVPVDVPSSKA